MNAREQLRRYLEQRREMGETELVLDSLSVEETLRILGVAAGVQRSDKARASHSADVAQAERITSQPDRAPESLTNAIPEAGDWRDALRAAGAAPDSMPKKPINSANASETRSLETPPRDAPRRAASPPEPAPRESSAASEDLAGIPAGLSVGTSAGELFGGGFCASLETLDALDASIASCRRCTLYSTATNPVPGEGNPNADFMCVGEAPGATEDETGRPFVGAAGQLLTKILGAIDLRREDVFICNVLKHRPPGNRNPLPEEVTACSPYLIRQIELIRPKVILALGTFAAQTLLDTKLTIGKLRGQVHRYYGVPLIVTYHPAALLRNPGWKRPTWEDVQLARRILDNAAGLGA